MAPSTIVQDQIPLIHHLNPPLLPCDEVPAAVKHETPSPRKALGTDSCWHIKEYIYNFLWFYMARFKGAVKHACLLHEHCNCLVSTKPLGSMPEPHAASVVTSPADTVPAVSRYLEFIWIHGWFLHHALFCVAKSLDGLKTWTKPP